MWQRALPIVLVMLMLTPVFPALAAEQDDEPGIDRFAPGRGEKGGIDYGLYVSGGKAARLMDLGPLNQKLAAAGVDPLADFVDDWTIELAFSGPRAGHFDLSTAWWDESTGGSPVRAELGGWEILGRWGAPLAQNRVMQLYPIIGIGYARRTLDLKGPLETLGLSDLRGEGAGLEQSGMLLEAGLRVESYGAWPKETKTSFLSVQAIGLGWQGVPIASEWLDGEDEIGGLPDLIHKLYLRFNLGFGLGGREKSQTADDDV